MMAFMVFNKKVPPSSEKHDQEWACTTYGAEWIMKTTLSTRDTKILGLCWPCILNHHGRLEKKTEKVYGPCGKKGSKMDHNDM